MCGATRDVRFGPKADILRAYNGVDRQPDANHFSCRRAQWANSGHPLQLLDYLVGAPDQCIGNVDAECLGGFEIYDQLDFRGLLDR
jgi:hypothetical protein